MGLDKKKSGATKESVAILIVEDVTEMRLLLEECVRATVKILPIEARVDSVPNTWTARQAILKHRPTIVLLDEILPGESSHDLAAELIADQVQVLALTSMEDPDHDLWPGAIGRLRKPEIDLKSSGRSEREFQKLLGSLLKSSL